MKQPSASLAPIDFHRTWNGFIMKTTICYPYNLKWHICSYQARKRYQFLHLMLIFVTRFPRHLINQASNGLPCQCLSLLLPHWAVWITIPTHTGHWNQKHGHQLMSSKHTSKSHKVVLKKKYTTTISFGQSINFLHYFQTSHQHRINTSERLSHRITVCWYIWVYQVNLSKIIILIFMGVKKDQLTTSKMWIRSKNDLDNGLWLPCKMISFQVDAVELASILTIIKYSVQWI